MLWSLSQLSLEGLALLSKPLSPLVLLSKPSSPLMPRLATCGMRLFAVAMAERGVSAGCEG